MRLGGWVIVFAANLPLPAKFALALTDFSPDQGGSVGMAAAAGVLATLGGVVCVRSRRVGRALIVGGAAVALSQVNSTLYAAFFLVAGWGGVAVASVMGVVDLDHDKAFGLAGGAVIAFVTGLLMIGAAAMIGLGLQAVIRGRWWGRGQAADPPGGPSAAMGGDAARRPVPDGGRDR